MYGWSEAGNINRFSGLARCNNPSNQRITNEWFCIVVFLQKHCTYLEYDLSDSGVYVHDAIETRSYNIP